MRHELFIGWPLRTTQVTGVLYRRFNRWKPLGLMLGLFFAWQVSFQCTMHFCKVHQKTFLNRKLCPACAARVAIVDLELLAKFGFEVDSAAVAHQPVVLDVNCLANVTLESCVLLRNASGGFFARNLSFK